MSVWVIGQVKIKNRAEYDLYGAKVLATMKNYQGRLVFLSDEVEVLEGEWHYPRTVIMEFADKKTAQAWYDSEEYQSIIPIRQSSAEANIIITESVLRPR